MANSHRLSRRGRFHVGMRLGLEPERVDDGDPDLFGDGQAERSHYGRCNRYGRGR